MSEQLTISVLDGATIAQGEVLRGRIRADQVSHIANALRRRHSAHEQTYMQDSQSAPEQH